MVAAPLRLEESKKVTATLELMVPVPPPNALVASVSVRLVEELEASEDALPKERAPEASFVVPNATRNPLLLVRPTLVETELVYPTITFESATVLVSNAPAA